MIRDLYGRTIESLDQAFAMLSDPGSGRQLATDLRRTEEPRPSSPEWTDEDEPRAFERAYDEHVRGPIGDAPSSPTKRRTRAKPKTRG